MKKPFDKEDQTLLLAAVVLGAATVGALSWLYFTRSGRMFINRRLQIWRP